MTESYLILGNDGHHYRDYRPHCLSVRSSSLLDFSHLLSYISGRVGNDAKYYHTISFDCNVMNQSHLWKSISRYSAELF